MLFLKDQPRMKHMALFYNCCGGGFVAKLCLTLETMDCSLPGSSVHKILQVRILEWVAISFFRNSSWPRNQSWVSCIAGRLFTDWAMREAPLQLLFPLNFFFFCSACLNFKLLIGFLGGSDGKESACNAGNLSSIPGLGRSPGGGHGNPLQYACLENPHEQRSLAGYSPWCCTELDMTVWLNTAQWVRMICSHAGHIYQW